MRANTALNLAFALLFAIVFCPRAAHAVPVVPGFDVETYVSLSQPGGITFDPSSSELYVGSSAASVKLRRVGVGGSPVVDYGDSTIFDPDTLLFETAGAISGVPGSILVGDFSNLLAVFPDETISNLFPANSFDNIGDLIFDGTGRLLFINISGQVYESTGGTPSVLFTIPDVGRSIAESGGQIYTSDGNGTIRIHSSTGALIDGSFATGLGVSPDLAFGTGGAFGTDLYTVGDGNLYRVDSLGNTTTIGTGFGVFAEDVEFGPDGALYVSGAGTGAIFRIAPAVPEPSSLVLCALLATLAIPFARWRARRAAYRAE